MSKNNCRVWLTNKRDIEILVPIEKAQEYRDQDYVTGRLRKRQKVDGNYQTIILKKDRLV